MKLRPSPCSHAMCLLPWTVSTVLSRRLITKQRIKKRRRSLQVQGQGSKKSLHHTEIHEKPKRKDIDILGYLLYHINVFLNIKNNNKAGGAGS